MPSAIMGTPDGYGPTAPSGEPRKVWNNPQAEPSRSVPDGEPMGFADFIDVINPLQHIPIVSTIYRSITGDAIKPGSRLIGGTLLGGPVGFAVASANVASELSTGQDVGDRLMAQLTGRDYQSNPTIGDGVLASGPDASSADAQFANAPPAASPWAANLATAQPPTGQKPPLAPEPAPTKANAIPPQPAQSVPVSPPPVPGRRPDPLSPAGGAATSGVHAAVQPKPAPTADRLGARTGDPRPLVGPRQDAAESQRAFFLPQPVVPTRTGSSGTGSVLAAPGQVVPSAPGALALTGPLSSPLTHVSAQMPAPTHLVTAQNDEARRQREAQERDQREAALAIDRFLRQAAIDSERRAANSSG